jgi:hypothetical protein
MLTQFQSNGLLALITWTGILLCVTLLSRDILMVGVVQGMSIVIFFVVWLVYRQTKIAEPGLLADDFNVYAEHMPVDDDDRQVSHHVPVHGGQGVYDQTFDAITVTYKPV